MAGSICTVSRKAKRMPHCCGFCVRQVRAAPGLVLVITGKGARAAEGERGVLKRQVPHWLGLPEFRALVIGFENAHIAHGGEGALYVRVRRARE